MSFKDAKDALGLYKHFCSQTKQVMEYLKQARDINNLIDVPIPNLKHVSSKCRFCVRPLVLILAMRSVRPRFRSSRLCRSTWTTQTLNKTGRSTRKTRVW